MYIYIYPYIHVYIYSYVHMHIYIYIYIGICAGSTHSLPPHALNIICIYIHTYTCVHKYMYSSRPLTGFFGIRNLGNLIHNSVLVLLARHPGRQARSLARPARPRVLVNDELLIL